MANWNPKKKQAHWRTKNKKAQERVADCHWGMKPGQLPGNIGAGFDVVDGQNHGKPDTLPEWMEQMYRWAEEVNDDIKALFKMHGIKGSVGDPPQPPW